MIPVRIDGATRELGAPPGMDNCGSLFIRDEVVDGLPRMVSSWLPTNDERCTIAAGGLVTMRITGVSHPPVSLSGHGELAADAGPDLDAIAKVIHGARYSPDYPADMVIPWEGEDDQGKEYCRRIARAVIGQTPPALALAA